MSKFKMSKTVDYIKLYAKRWTKIMAERCNVITYYKLPSVTK